MLILATGQCIQHERWPFYYSFRSSYLRLDLNKEYLPFLGEAHHVCCYLCLSHVVFDLALKEIAFSCLPLCYFQYLLSREQLIMSFYHLSGARSPCCLLGLVTFLFVTLLFSKYLIIFYEAQKISMQSTIQTRTLKDLKE